MGFNSFIFGRFPKNPVFSHSKPRENPALTPRLQNAKRPNSEEVTPKNPVTPCFLWHMGGIFWEKHKISAVFVWRPAKKCGTAANAFLCGGISCKISGKYLETFRLFGIQYRIKLRYCRQRARCGTNDQKTVYCFIWFWPSKACFYVPCSYFF